jgi:predicted  nucleic acid-binding Zn-ribbon protein
MAEEAIKQETNEEETVEVTLDDKETKTETKSEEVKSPEVEVEKPEEKKQEESGDELEQYSEGVQKRINKLTARLRESERREKATMDYAKGVQKELKEIQTQSKTIDGNFVQEFKNRVTLH